MLFPQSCSSLLEQATHFHFHCGIAFFHLPKVTSLIFQVF